MKHLSKLLGLSLAVVALLLSACAKKPIRDPQVGAMGPKPDEFVQPVPFGVDPNEPAIPVRSEGTINDSSMSVVDPVYFALDRYAVAPAERPKLQSVLAWLQSNPGKNLVLVGHCDWRGTAEYNLGLGENRSNSVKRYLVSLGADATRLETLSKGSTEAKQSGGEADWAKDRRVDFIELVKQ